MPPPLRYALISSPPRPLGEKGKNRIRRFTKKSVHRLTIWANIILSPKTEKMWCMAILGVGVMGSGHYRDEKFSYFWVWARGSPQTLTLFGVTPRFWQFLGFDYRRSSTAGSRPVKQQIISYGVVAERQMMLMIPTIVLLYRQKSRPTLLQIAAKSRALIFG